MTAKYYDRHRYELDRYQFAEAYARAYAKDQNERLLDLIKECLPNYKKPKKHNTTYFEKGKIKRLNSIDRGYNKCLKEFKQNLKERGIEI